MHLKKLDITIDVDYRKNLLEKYSAFSNQQNKVVTSENLKGGKNDSLIKQQLQNITGPPKGRRLKVIENQQDITLPLVYPSTSKAKNTTFDQDSLNDSMNLDKGSKTNNPYSLNKTYNGYVRTSKSKEKSKNF